MANPQPLDPARHGQLRVSPQPALGISAGQQVLPVTVFEFAPAGNDCPVVFIKNADTGQFQSVMLLGLAENENLIYRDGQWQGTYVPGVLRNGPFKLLMTDASADSASLGIDLDSPLVGDGGERLFDDEGNPTEFLMQRREQLGNYYQQSNTTRGFLSLLVEQNLLKPQMLSIDLDGEKAQLQGIYLVDEEKLRELPDAVVVDYHRRGFLQAIYAHLMSLRQAAGLARRKVASKRGSADILGT